MATTKVLVLYYSSYGHVAAMARAVAGGAAEVTNQVHVKRVPETVPEQVATKSGFRPALQHQVAEPAELADYDAIIVGTPTNYGNLSAQVSEFWARTIGLWKTGALIGKVGGGFSSSATQHGGNEATLLSLHKTMMHHGMIVVGLPYVFEGQTGTDQVAGGSPYGATTIAAGDMSRQPSVTDLDGAKFQGRHIAAIAARLKAARA